MPSPEFLKVFRQRADSAGQMPFGRFVELALYDPAVGYYCKTRPRVGYSPGTDFFTASTSGRVFGELVAQACRSLLGGQDPARFQFVEIGAEPEVDGSPDGVLRGIDHPFAGSRTVRAGEPLSLSGPCVVFSNELFDAQGFSRHRFRAGKWRSLGVAVDSGRLVEVEQGDVSPGSGLPEGTEGYVLDSPTGATALAAAIAAQPWTGLFVAIDYGLSEDALFHDRPAGTARAYYRHTLSNDLLARPGEQDLTCHICWDWLARALATKGFESPVLESQEEFFVHHAGPAIAARAEASAGRLDREKLSMMQLLHPAHLGQKFQVMHATRW